jgi:uncharacterized protein (DUF1015 family)
MPEFLPFIGTRFDKSKVSTEDVVAPPYDVISPDYRDVLYSRNDHNIIRLELSRDDDPYVSARNALREWLQEGYLVREKKPAFYVYYQTFTTPAGETVTREGVLGKLKLATYAEKQVLPHERTLMAPKRDRMKLLEHTHTNVSPIFALTSDPSFVFDETLQLATVMPALADVDEALPAGGTVRHTMWRLDDAMACDRIEKIIARGPVIIADGHHRYETALKYRDEHPDEPEAAYVLCFIANLNSAGTVVLPTHRVLHSVTGFNQYTLLEDLRTRFEIVAMDTREEATALLDRDDDVLTIIQLPEAPHYVAVRDLPTESRSPIRLVNAKRLEEEILLPVVGLSRQAIDEKRNLLYPHSLTELDDMLESAEWNAAFLLRAIRPSEMQQVVERGDFMPQKSTFFYPKLLTGLVMRQFDPV